MSKKLLEYKGYTGSKEISDEDDCLYGRILFIDDLIIYEGASPSQLFLSFKEAVDRYLDYCESTGTAPNKQYSGTFNIRVGSDLHRDACKQAALDGTTLNDFVKDCLAQRLSPSRVIVAVTENHHHYYPEKQSYNEESFPEWPLTNREANAAPQQNRSLQ